MSGLFVTLSVVSFLDFAMIGEKRTVTRGAVGADE